MDKYWLWLSEINGVGPVTMRKLIKSFGTPQAVYEADKSELEAAGLRQGIVTEILTQRSLDIALREEEKMYEFRVNLLPFTDSLYPEKLNAIPSLPALLYYRGELERSVPSVGIVGSRRCTEYGKRVASEAATALAQKGIIVASGFAKGLDSYAHTACIKAGGKTLAFFANGLDICYPPEQKTLMNEIIENGAIITPFPLGTRPRQAFFPLRNKLISAWVDSLLVVEAAERSGALITADYALKINRKVYAVPNNIYVLESMGTNKLLQRGAEVYFTPAQLYSNQSEPLEKSPLSSTTEADHRLASSGNNRRLTEEESAILQQLNTPKHLNELMNIYTGTYSDFQNLICTMEIDGLITVTGNWIRLADTFEK